MFLSPKQTILHKNQNEINTVNQLQLNYLPPIDTAIYKYFVCYNYKSKYTDWCPIPNDSGWGICLHMWKPGKEVTLTILINLNNVRFIVESQCNSFSSFNQPIQNCEECLAPSIALPCTWMTNDLLLITILHSAVPV